VRTGTRPDNGDGARGSRNEVRRRRFCATLRPRHWCSHAQRSKK
jgi:hypothetical protein